MRRGTTLLESLLATALALGAIAAILMIFYSMRKMEGAGDVAGALQEATLAMAIIQEDLAQAVQNPDEPDAAVAVRKNSVQLLRGRLKPDGSVDANLVMYQKVPTPGGNFRLKRTYGGKGHLLPGMYRSVGFVLLKGPGGPFVRAVLHVAVKDTRVAKDAQAGGLEEVVKTALVRVQGPEMAGSSLFGWSILDLLRKIPFLRNFF